MQTNPTRQRQQQEEGSGEEAEPAFNLEASAFHFFEGLQRDDSYLRAEAAQDISRQLRTWACSDHEDEHSKVVKLLPTVMRLARECPFKEIRDVFRDLEKHLCEESCLALPILCITVSKFLKRSCLPDIASLDASSPLLPWFEDMFLMRGRVTHLDQVMAIQPEFSRAHFSTYNFIMRQDGPLSLAWRNYLAILASARFRCQYLVSLQESEFLMNGGNPNWLKSVSNAPLKLQHFLTLNAYMAHQPWLITKSMISDIVRNGISLSELVHAIMIMALFHALCGFVHGLDVVSEVDLVQVPTFNDKSTLQAKESAEICESVESHSKSSRYRLHDEATRNLKVLLQTNLDVLIAKHGVDDPFELAGSDEEISKEPVASDSEEPEIKEESVSTNLLYSKYIGDVEPTLKYEDYDVKSTTYKVFRMQDYNWKDHGYSLVMRYYNNAAQLLDRELDLIYNLTDRSLSEEQREIDTGPFRRAIWHYAQRLFGISNDAYNYQEVNIFLNKNIKQYIKKTTCLSDTVDQRDFFNLGYHFRPDECVHITLLAVEGRRQSELLYALHAVYELQKNSL